MLKILSVEEAKERKQMLFSNILKMEKALDIYNPETSYYKNNRNEVTIKYMEEKCIELLKQFH